MNLTGAFYRGTIHNVNGVVGNDSKRYTAVLESEYAFSKRSHFYVTVDYNKVSGGAVTELPRRSHQTGLTIGMRHAF
ncbi:hypothetical protein R8510_05135 [Ralstonia chuxiongensis]|nr:hypothetical protein R8510_05135 [Ralstonia chuxiongensis]